MLKNTRQRRTIGIVLILLGALLMLLAPEVWAGLIMITIAFILEAVGIALEHSRQDQDS